MRLQAENLEQAALSRVASRIVSRIGSIAPSLVASAIQSRRTSRLQTPTRGSAMSSRYDYLLNTVLFFTSKFFLKLQNSV